MVKLPKVVKVRQRFARDHISDVERELREKLREFDLGRCIRSDDRVAVTAGSRGIANIVSLTAVVVKELEELGARPFIVPAMGSHGGATAEGQREVLAGYGISERTVGVPILSSMETVELGRTEEGMPVYMDEYAYSADAMMVMNRIKAHTAFRAPIESGLSKMMAVGLGKQRGAELMHAWGLAESIPSAAEVILEKANIVAGIGLVENAHHETYCIQVVPPERIHQTDRELLKLANEHLPRVPFDSLDVLVIDWMGKDISGGGMDPNVIGMWRRVGGERKPYYRHVVVLKLTPASHGNATGVGGADFIPRRLFEEIDLEKTYANIITAAAPASGKIPIIMGSDREAIEVALEMAAPRGEPRLARIRSTLHLDELYVSEGLLEEVRANLSLEIIGEPESLSFDGEERLLDVWAG